MASLSGIRNKLETKIFSKFGSTATLASLSSQSVDKWGDDTPTYGAGSSITVVPYDYVVNRLNYQPFGDLQDNEVAMVVPYTVSLGARDKLTYSGVDYLVVEIEQFIFNDGVIAQAVKLVKRA